jgi:hypothetical protein
MQNTPTLKAYFSFGDYWHILNKYEEAEERIRRLEEEIEQRQAVIEKYRKWFERHEYLIEPDHRKIKKR